MMQKLHRPILTLHPERIDIDSAWIGHLPFALWIIDAVRPRRLVELGTHGGVSYCTFCQAIKHLQLPTEAYAVDTWEGDDHTGDYSNATWVELKAYHDERYSSFSELVRTTFDSAAEKFAPGSIDLLHIDGLHTYDAVSHDFATWLPKLSDSAVVLFHDTNVYERDFGVQQFWREVSAEYPSFSFLHGHGLGVLAVGGNQSKALQWLTSLADGQVQTVRDTFSTMALPLHAQASLQAEVAGLRVDVQRIDKERHAAVVQMNKLAELRRSLERDVLSLGESLAEREEELVRHNARIAQLLTDTDGLRERASQASVRAATLETELTQIRQTSSWRLTAPLRRLNSQGRRLTGPASSTFAVLRALGRPGGVRKAANALRTRGVVGSVKRLRKQVAAARSHEHALSTGANYAQWVSRYDTLTADDLLAIAGRIRQLEYQPLISVVLPVYNTRIEYLEACIDSVLDQAYGNWQLCIADDCSPTAEVQQVIRSYERRDSRISSVFRDSQGGIAQCTNSALALVEGEFVALLDHDDLLPRHALYMVVEALNEEPELDLIFSDEDKIDEQGLRFDPHFKSDFNYELLLGQNCISHLGVYRASLIASLGGIRTGFDGSQDHDLALRVVQESAPERIHHIPHILYHWRVFGDSGSFSTDHLDKAVTAGVAAVQEHLDTALGADYATAAPAGVGGFLRVRWPLPAQLPGVTAVIPTRDNPTLLRNCVEGLLHNTSYDNLDVLIINNDSKDAATLTLLESLAQLKQVRVVDYNQPFNYSAINNFGIEHVRSEYLCLLNDDIEVISPDWLSEMMALAVRPGVGAVGARLLYADNTVQHGGVMLGVMGVANHLHKHQSVESPGYFGRLQLTQELAGVTAACMVVSRAAYKQVGGLDAENLAVAFNDVDFCLRLRAAGYRNLWTPHATLYHLESASRGSDMDADKFQRFEKEVNFMLGRWPDELQRDPFYNPNLSIEEVDMDLADPPRAIQPWRT